MRHAKNANIKDNVMSKDITKYKNSFFASSPTGLEELLEAELLGFGAKETKTVKGGVHFESFSDIAINYLKIKGFEPYLCRSEEEARELINTLPSQGKWPCFFTKSDTTGEKDIEEFYTEGEILDMSRFENLGIIKNEVRFNNSKLEKFESDINNFKYSLSWTKSDIVSQFHSIIPEFNYEDKGKYLDGKM